MSLVDLVELFDVGLVDLWHWVRATRLDFRLVVLIVVIEIYLFAWDVSVWISFVAFFAYDVNWP